MVKFDSYQKHVFVYLYPDRPSAGVHDEGSWRYSRLAGNSHEIWMSAAFELDVIYLLVFVWIFRCYFNSAYDRFRVFVDVS